MTIYNQKSALNYLMINTHLFFPPEVANDLTRPFGFEARCYVEKANPRDPKGLTLPHGLRQMKGIASWDLARQICDHVGGVAESSLGRGSQQRNYVRAAMEKLGIKESSNA